MKVAQARLAGLVLTICLAVSACTGASPSSTAAEVASLRELIDGARQEGAVELWYALPAKPETLHAWQDAFNRRFDLDIRLEQVALPAREAITRVVSESQAGHPVGDVISPNAEFMKRGIDAGVIAKVDWKRLFGEELPQIADAYDVYIPELDGYGLHYTDIVYVIAYNEQLIDPRSIPRNWERLGDPRWDGKLAVDSRGPPFMYLSYLPDWPGERVSELVHAIGDNHPLLPNPSRLDEVSRGEVTLQVGAFDAVQELRSRGAPIDSVFADPVPLNPSFVSVPTSAKHPNAARLFAAWLAAEGIDIHAELEGPDRLTDPDSKAARALHARLPDARLTIPTTLDALLRTRAVGVDVAKFWAGLQAG